MASATNHMLRSHRSYGQKADFSDFHRKAHVKKMTVENRGIFTKLFKRTTNK